MGNVGAFDAAAAAAILLPFALLASHQSLLPQHRPVDILSLLNDDVDVGVRVLFSHIFRVTLKASTSWTSFMYVFGA